MLLVFKNLIGSQAACSQCGDIRCEPSAPCVSIARIDASAEGGGRYTPRGRAFFSHVMYTTELVLS